jgi:hypothetical protein
MPAKPRTPQASASRPVSITAVVDCVGALAAGSLRGHLYLFDTNKSAGSSGLGTERLLTRAARGTQVIWNALALECEAYVAIDSIAIDADVCEPERRLYPGSDIAYWIGTVKSALAGPVDYGIAFRLGSRAVPLGTVVNPALTG